MSLKLRDGVYHWRKMVEGHKFSRSTKTADKRMAEQLAAVWEAEVVKEVVMRGTKPVNLHQVIEAFLAAREGKGGHANAKVHLSHFLALPNIRMSDITLLQLQQVINKRRASGTSHNTLCVSVSYWNAVVRFASDQKWTTAVRLPRMVPEKTRIRYLSEREEAALFAAISPDAKYPGKCERTDRARQDNTDLLIALLALGCRYREISRMTWDQVDMATRQVALYRVKGGVDGTLEMSNLLFQMLSRRKAAATTEWVFPTKRTHNNNYAWMRDALERAGIKEEAGKVTLHTMRHTFATRVLKGGLNLIETQQMLGHKNIQSTMVYAHIETTTVASRAAQILNGS